MIIKIVGDKLIITPKVRKLVHDKIATDLEKYLPKLNQEIKTATMTFHRHSRWGYEINFDLWLPETYHVYANVRAETILAGLVDLRNKLIRQIKKYKEKLKNEN